MKALGYATHVVGKWDAGMSTPDHTPEGRGFDSSLIYFEHKVDYWNQQLMQSACQAYNPSVDLWDTGAPARALNGTRYVEYLFRDRVLESFNRVLAGDRTLIREAGQARGDAQRARYASELVHRGRPRAAGGGRARPAGARGASATS
jgi:hypothetical protein